MDGLLQSLLNYGNILIQTAGGNVNVHIFIDKTPEPGETARKIMDAVNVRREQFQGKDGGETPTALKLLDHGLP